MNEKILEKLEEKVTEGIKGLTVMDITSPAYATTVNNIYETSKLVTAVAQMLQMTRTMKKGEEEDVKN